MSPAGSADTRAAPLGLRVQAPAGRPALGLAQAPGRERSLLRPRRPGPEGGRGRHRSAGSWPPEARGRLLAGRRADPESSLVSHLGARTVQQGRPASLRRDAEDTVTQGRAREEPGGSGTPPGADGWLALGVPVDIWSPNGLRTLGLRGLLLPQTHIPHPPPLPRADSCTLARSQMALASASSSLEGQSAFPWILTIAP